MAYDYSKLLGRITEKFGTQARFSGAMGMSERSLSLKLNSKVPFKQPEISKACSLLVHWKRNPTTCRLCLGGTFLSVKRSNYRQR